MALAPTELVAPQEDIDAVMTAALDYIDGYVEETRSDVAVHTTRSASNVGT